MWLNMLPAQLDPAVGGPFAHPIIVRGHSVELVYAEFKSEPENRDPMLDVGAYRLDLEIRTSTKSAWQSFWCFTINVDERARLGLKQPSLHLNRPDGEPVPGWELRNLG